MHAALASDDILAVGTCQQFGKSHRTIRLSKIKTIVHYDCFPEFFRVWLRSLLFATPWGKFLKRSVVLDNKILFDTKLKTGEDTCFMCDFLEFCKFVKIVPSSIYYYYTDTVSQQKKYAMDIDEYEIHVKTYFYHLRKLEDKWNCKLEGMENISKSFFFSNYLYRISSLNIFSFSQSIRDFRKRGLTAYLPLYWGNKKEEIAKKLLIYCPIIYYTYFKIIKDKLL